MVMLMNKEYHVRAKDILFERSPKNALKIEYISFSDTEHNNRKKRRVQTPQQHHVRHLLRNKQILVPRVRENFCSGRIWGNDIPHTKKRSFNTEKDKPSTKDPHTKKTQLAMKDVKLPYYVIHLMSLHMNLNKWISMSIWETRNRCVSWQLSQFGMNETEQWTTV